jgi:hypothetical protein
VCTMSKSEAKTNQHEPKGGANDGTKVKVCEVGRRSHIHRNAIIIQLQMRLKNFRRQSWLQTNSAYGVELSRP